MSRWQGLDVCPSAMFMAGIGVSLVRRPLAGSFADGFRYGLVCCQEFRLGSCGLVIDQVVVCKVGVVYAAAVVALRTLVVRLVRVVYSVLKVSALL